MLGKDGKRAKRVGNGETLDQKLMCHQPQGEVRPDQICHQPQSEVRPDQLIIDHRAPLSFVDGTSVRNMQCAKICINLWKKGLEQKVNFDS